MKPASKNGAAKRNFHKLLPAQRKNPSIKKDAKRNLFGKF